MSKKDFQNKKQWNQSTHTAPQSSSIEKEPMVPLSVIHQVIDLLNEFVSQVEDVCLHYGLEDTEGMEEDCENTHSEE